MLDLSQVLATIGLTDALDLFEAHWDESEACFPAGGPLFLLPVQITEMRHYLGLPEEMDPSLHEAARIIRAEPALAHLAWHCYRLLFFHQEFEGGKMARWPEPVAQLGDLAGLFYVLISLPVVPLTRAAHMDRGVPDSVTRHTLTRYVELVDRYRMTHPGRWGLALGSLYWKRLYVNADLYACGRFEYMVRPFHGAVRVFRHGQTRQTIALAVDGTQFDADGLMVQPLSEGWTARLAIDETSVTGCPVSPTGFAENREVTLPLHDWQQVLAPGDPTLDMHIPAGGGMTLERCLDSMKQAMEFFPHYFPERPFVAFACYSWIFHPEMARVYTPESNMVLYQKELYMFPIGTDRRSGLYFVFGTQDVDPATAPRDTSLRRAVLAELERDGRLLAGGMFFLADDIEHFGTQFYLKHFPGS